MIRDIDTELRIRYVYVLPNMGYPSPGDTESLMRMTVYVSFVHSHEISTNKLKFANKIANYLAETQSSDPIGLSHVGIDDLSS